MTDVNTTNLPWPISEALVEIIQAAVRECAGVCIVNFRDPNYSPETGGYHPVEIMVGEKGEILYITDFSFSGRGGEAELSKEIDFDFSTGSFQHLGREYPLSTGRSLYRTWQSNFTTYFKMGVFQVNVEEIQGDI